MAVEINILSDEGTNFDLLTDEERETFYDNMRKRTGLSLAQMGGIIDAAMPALDETMPSSHDLIVRRIIALVSDLAVTHSSGGPSNTIVVPIIKRVAVVGGHARSFRPTTKQRSVDAEPGVVRVRLGRTSNVIEISGDYKFSRVAAANDEVDVVGLMIAGAEYTGMNVSTGPPVLRAPSIFEYINTGYFSPREIYTATETPGLILRRATYSFTEDTLPHILEVVFHAVVSLTRQIRSVVGWANAYRHALTLITTTVAPPLSVVKLPAAEIDASLAMFEKIAPVKFTTPYRIAALLDVFNNGLESIYTSTRIHGLGSSQAESGMLLRERSAATLDAARAIKREQEQNRITVSLYLDLARGTSLYQKIANAVHTRPSLRSDPVRLLSILGSDGEKIRLAYEKMTKRLDERVSNKCPHVAIRRKFARAKTTIEAKKLFAELMSYELREVSTGYIKCSACNYDLICPHVVAQAKLGDAPQGVVARALTPFMIGGKCRICNEQVYDEFSDDAIELEHVNVTDEKIADMIWREIVIVARNLKYSAVVDTTQLFKMCSNACYGFVVAIDREVGKSKTASADEIRARVRLGASYFIVAYLCAIVISRADSSITFRNFVPDKARLAASVISHGLDIIMSTYDVAINQIPGMNREIVKTHLANAYREMTLKPVDVIVEGQPEDPVITMLHDPVFKYIVAMTRTTTGELIGDYVNGIDTLGFTPESLRALPAKQRYIPRGKKQQTDAPDSLYSAAGPLSARGSDWAKYVIDSYNFFIAAIQSRLRDVPVFIDGGSRAETETIVLVLAPEHEARATEFAKLTARELELVDKMIFAQIQPGHGLVATTSRLFEKMPISIARVFDDSGRKHSWGLYVCADGVTRTKKELVAADEPIAIVDRKCTDCGESRGNPTGNTKTIIAAVAAAATENNFFRFYESRCPVAKTHTIVSGICSACGWDQHADATNRAAYLKKYIRAYREERASNPIVTAPLPVIVQDPVVAERVRGYVENYGLVTTLAQRVGIDHKILAVIGSVQNTDYSVVAAGKYVPRDPETRATPRPHLVYSQTRALLTEYNQIRHAASIFRMPPELSALIDSSSLSRNQIVELAELPDVYDLHSETFELFRSIRKPREIVSFCVEQFCKTCLDILDLAGDVHPIIAATKKLRRDLVVRAVKRAIAADYFRAKPGYFSWSLIYGDKDTGESSEITEADNDTEEYDNSDDENPFANTFDMEAAEDGELNELRVEGYDD